MHFVIPAPAQAILPVQGQSGAFPIHRIYCVGRNYAAHTVEMGGNPDRESPFFFQKSPDNLVINGGDFPYPTQTEDVHHEVELVVAISVGGKEIALDRALDCVWGYTVGLDMTRRDLQSQCKEKRRPWEIGKAFEHSAPCGALVPVAEIGHPQNAAIWLEVNGVRRQEGNLNQQIWKVPEIIAYLSAFFDLCPGDLIMTGTPSGVAAIQKADSLKAHIEGVGELHTKVV